MFVYTALLTLAVSTAASAERLYVPVLGAPAADGRAMPTEIWVANGAQAKTLVTAGFVRGLSAKARSFDVEPGGRMLERLAGSGEIGLVAVDADELAVSAWVPSADGGSVSEVPVIGPHDSYVAGAEPGLELAREYDRLLVGAANVSDQAASCQATLFDAANREIGRIPFEVPSKALVREDAAGWLGSQRAASAQVSCDREFYPIGVTTANSDRGDTRVIVAKGIGPNGACQKWLTLAQTGTVWGAAIDGTFHSATRANPKGIVCVKLPVAEIRVGKAIFEWDVSVGPWSSRDKSGVHNLGYFFRDRYRSGIIGNINFLGPNKDLAKWMQNYNMPRGSNTNAKGAFKATANQNVVYHLVYIFDANNKSATLHIQDSGHNTLQSLTNRTAPGNGQALVLKPFGSGGLAGLSMVNEFGNYVGQHHPEEATIDWQYANLLIAFTTK
jgi:hypothetical protein